MGIKSNISQQSSSNDVNVPVILSFIVLSNISTIAILGYLTTNDYIYQFYQATISQYIQEDKFPLASIFILSLLHFIFPYITLQDRIINGYYNTNYPRIGQKEVKGFGLRIQSGYENFIETYPIYMVAIILAHIKNLNLNYQISLTLTLIIGRYLHLVFYSLNIPLLRAFTFQYSQYSALYLILLSIFPQSIRSVLDFISSYIG